MAIQSTFYDLDGTTRSYGSTKHIATKQHMAVWLQRIDDDSFEQLASTIFSLINNYAVLDDAVDNTIYKQLEVRVADNEDELTQSPADIAIVAAIDSEIQIVAGIASQVVTVADNDANVTLVGNDLAKGIGTNQPTDSAILNALTNANQTIADVVLTNADVVSTNADVVLTHADVVLTNADVISASDSADEAAASALSIDPTTLLHTVGDGAGNPEGLSTSNIDEIKIGSLSIGQNISITSWSYSGTTITINTDVVHNLKVGDATGINGLVSTTNAPNGLWLVATIEDTDTITFTATDTPTGTPTVSSATIFSGVLTIQSIGWGNDGVDYIDLDAVGANPTAKIYPDGTIVGSTDNGSYVKYPNGDLDCMKRNITTTTKNIYPILFMALPFVATSIESTVDKSVVAAVSIDGISLYGFTEGAGATGSPTAYIAKGRWK